MMLSVNTHESLNKKAIQNAVGFSLSEISFLWRSAHQGQREAVKISPDVRPGYPT
jgi:hypothetical protein